jgi:hypothetical protein
VKHDKEGNVVDFKMNASTEDFIKLAVAAIVAAYERRGEEVPIGTDEILYDADPSEVKLLINTVMELRLRWYAVPKTVVESEFEPAADAADTAAKKNVDAPASDSKGS